MIFERLLGLYEVLMYSDGGGNDGHGSGRGEEGGGWDRVKVGTVNKAECVRELELIEVT